MAENTDKRNATQKIEDLEKVVTMLYQAVAQLQNVAQGLSRAQGETPMIKEAIKLLNRKADAIIQAATPETGITAKAVESGVTAMNIQEMKGQVEGYLAAGHLVSSPGEVAANSYLVCEEYNIDGTVANPRIQFRLDSQDEVTTAALIGKKAGETISFGENKFSAKILEIYTLVEPKAPEASTLQAVPDAPAAPEASVATPDAAPTDAEKPQEAATESAALPALPAETPVATFVPSEPGNMLTANS